MSASGQTQWPLYTIVQSLFCWNAKHASTVSDTVYRSIVLLGKQARCTPQHTPNLHYMCKHKHTDRQHPFFRDTKYDAGTEPNTSVLSGSYWQYQSVKLCFSSLFAFAHFHINKRVFIILFSNKACFRNDSPFIDQL